jgi:hypothetical protein
MNGCLEHHSSQAMITCRSFHDSVYVTDVGLVVNRNGVKRQVAVRRASSLRNGTSNSQIRLHSATREGARCEFRPLLHRAQLAGCRTNVNVVIRRSNMLSRRDCFRRTRIQAVIEEYNRGVVSCTKYRSASGKHLHRACSDVANVTIVSRSTVLTERYRLPGVAVLNPDASAQVNSIESALAHTCVEHYIAWKLNFKMMKWIKLIFVVFVHSLTLM